MTPRLCGFAIAALTLAIDQANKLWLMDVYDIAANQPVRLAPVFDVVFARNPGISYSLLPAHSPGARWALVAFTLAATIGIGIWLWRTPTRVPAIGLGLVLGGALGNAIDRFAYGWVADFYYFHVGGFTGTSSTSPMSRSSSAWLCCWSTRSCCRARSQPTREQPLNCR